MTKFTGEQSPFLHVAVDWDVGNIENLPDDRKAQALAGARDFKADLRQRGVQTLMVAMPRANGAFVFREARDPWNRQNEKRLEPFRLMGTGLYDLDVRTDEDILIKGLTGSFAQGHLKQFIEEKYGNPGILVSGGLTTVCVRDTISGALRSGFNVCAIYDQMYTTREWDEYPEAHTTYLEEWHREKTLTEPASVTKRPRMTCLSAREAIENLDYL